MRLGATPLRKRERAMAAKCSRAGFSVEKDIGLCAGHAALGDLDNHFLVYMLM
jgi:hypothetical protein